MGKHTFESGDWLPSAPQFAMVLGLLLLGNASINFSTSICENADGENDELGKAKYLNFIYHREKSSQSNVNNLRIFLTWCSSSLRDDNFLLAIEMKARCRGTCAAKTFRLFGKNLPLLHTPLKKFNTGFFLYLVYTVHPTLAQEDLSAFPAMRSSTAVSIA